jgi:uncharacterized phage-like protein YoqJ
MRDVPKEVAKYLGLKSGDKFILKHWQNENQNKYTNILFTVDYDNNILPEDKFNPYQVLAGFYKIEKQ